MLQVWKTVLFLHWPVDKACVARLLPREVEVDTFDGNAWVSLVPFTMSGIRHPLGPPIPGLNAMHELNVRTYVRHQGVPGVWFFSLDASNGLMVRSARSFYHLPYFKARMSLVRKNSRVNYRSERRHRGSVPATLEIVWESGDRLPEAPAGSREFFLTERYSLFTAHKTFLYQGRILHSPWPLQSARVLELRSDVVQASGIELPGLDPVVHYSDRVEVEIWPLRKSP